MNIQKCLLVSVLLSLPAVATAQSMTVFGGHQKARECYANVEISGNLGYLTHSILTPCTYALENVDMERDDRAATYNNRGILHYNLREYDAAFSDFESAMNLLPNRPEITINRGNLHYLTDDFDSAIQDYNTALEMPGAPIHAIQLNLGMVYERLKDYATAEQHYRTALELMPEWDRAHERLNGLDDRREAEARREEERANQRQPFDPRDS